MLDEATGAANTGLTQEVVAWRLEMLASALTDFRSSARAHSEPDVQRAWRAFWADRVDLLNHQRSYLDIARAIHLYLKILESVDDDSRLTNIENLASGGWIIAMGVERGEADDNEVAGIFTKVFRDDGEDLRGLPSQRLAAMFGSMHQLQQMRSYIGDSGPLSRDDLYRLWDYALGAHALNAPAGLADLIAARVSVEEVQATPNGADSKDPNSLVEAILVHQIHARESEDAAEKALGHLRSEGALTRQTLLSGNPPEQVLRILESVGISVAAIRRLQKEQAEYSRKGFMGRSLMGSRQPELMRASHKALDGWTDLLDQRQSSLETLRAQNAADLVPLVDAVRRLKASEEFEDTMRLAVFTGYVGGTLKDGGFAARVASAMWTSDPLGGDIDAQLPYIDYSRVPTCWVPNGLGLSYGDACSGVRELVVQSLAVALPRMMKITWIDPAGRGSSAGPLLELLEIDKELLDGQVWSESEHIDAALRRITDRIAYIEQRCLKDRFANIDAYNMEAGSLAESDHVVVVTGFPRNFSSESIERLYQVIEHGRRAGVSVHMVMDEQVSHSASFGVRRHTPVLLGIGNGGFTNWNGRLPLSVWVYGANGHAHSMLFVDEFQEAVGLPIVPFPGDPAHARKIIESYASAAAEAAEVVVTSDALASSSPDAAGNSAEELVIPIGVMGRGDTLELRLGKGLAQNVLIGGLPGSGKSTLFHTIIASAVRQYDPEELQLYLLDFKQGVEFQPYAEMQLPHARVVAIQSEREFGLSVLRNLREEIDRRAELFRAPSVGADSIKEYRARTGEKLPRLLLIVDEFQVLFNDDDADAAECLQLLDAIVRQGRAFGVHAILGTQTLRGHGHMSQLSGTLDQVALRIVLKTSEADSRRFLSDDNPAGARLTRPGEAIFNPDGGRIEGNLVFQVALTSDESRDGVVKAARLAADETGFSRKPLVFDGTRAITIEESEQMTGVLKREVASDRRALSLNLGLPVSINGDGAVRLWRRSGGNLLVLSRDVETALGAVSASLLSASVSAGTNLQMLVVENLGIDEDGAEVLAQVTGFLPNATYRRRKLDQLLGTLFDEVHERVETEDYGRQRILLVINGLQRARELGEDTYFDQTDKESPRGKLRSVLRDGPEVGVHCLVVADTVDTLDRRLGDSALAEFGARFITQCSSVASQRLLASERGTTLGSTYAIISEPDDDRCEKIRPFPIPDEYWLSMALEEPS